MVSNWLHVFLAKASVDALRRFPSVNAELRGKQHCVSSLLRYWHRHRRGKGLVVPVLRNVRE